MERLGNTCFITAKRTAQCLRQATLPGKTGFICSRGTPHRLSLAICRRREALSPVLSKQTSEKARAALAVELTLTQQALSVNPKSYAAWHHRGWAVVTGGADLQQELALVHKCARGNATSPVSYFAD